MVTRAFILGCVALGAGACNWSIYDELADEAWVDRVTTPDATDSRLYGAALVSPPSRTPGASAFVIGTARASLSTLSYDDEGKRLPVNAVDPRTPLAFAGFPDRPALAGDPDSDRVAFTIVMGNNVDPTRVVVFDARTLENVKMVQLNDLTEVDGTERLNIYAEGINFGTLPGFGMDTIKELVVARGPQLVLIQDYSEADSGTTFAVKGCRTGADWSYAGLIANVIDDAVHPGPEVLIATGEELRNEDSAIHIYDPALITMPYADEAACPPSLIPPIVSTEGAGDLGARLVAAQFPDVVDPDPLAALDDLVYSAPSLNKVFVRFGGGTATEIAAADAGSDFGDVIVVADLLDDDGVPELIIGAPRSDPEGVSNGGSVYIYRFVATPAPSFVLALRLYPASPAEEERFGRSVAVAPFGATGTKKVLMVGAEGAVFTYFRTSVDDDDVRLGRGTN
jgi:hypothetical protein